MRSRLKFWRALGGLMRDSFNSAACAFVACFFLVVSQAMATAPAPTPLQGLSFLVGTWQASGSGHPGHSTGEFSFEWAADHHALVRHNEAVAPTGRHSDIMLVYALADGTIRAVYADNEGHTIHYRVSLVPGRERVVFESSGPGPRFRLWYQARSDGSLETGFQIAPPGSSGFKTYLEGVARRK